MATLKAAIIPVTPLQQNSCVIWKESSKIAAVTDPVVDIWTLSVLLGCGELNHLGRDVHSNNCTLSEFPDLAGVVTLPTSVVDDVRVP